MKGRKKLVYIAPYWNTFIKSDFELLSKHFDVSPLIFGNKHDFLIPFYFIRQFFLVSYFSLTQRRLFFIQFGGYHSLFPAFLASILGRKAFVVVHGTDACSFKSINYGVLRKPWLRLFCLLSYKLCSKILPVSESLVRTQNHYYLKNEILNFGLLHEFPTLSPSKIYVIHNGLNSESWPHKGLTKKYNFISVAGGQSIKQLRKGIDLILQTAEQLPNLTFVIVGIKEYETTKTIRNITFIPRVCQNELIDLYNESSFYLQLSIFEGFGLALCEAMLCGCIPIVSSVNMMPEIIGNTGFILKKRDSEMLGYLLSEAASMPKEEMKVKARLARQRIVDEYPISKREREILHQLS